MKPDKKKSKKPKNRRTKKILIFDEKAREEFLTGFQKRKNERRKKAQDELKVKMKEEKRNAKIRRRKLLQDSMNYTGKKKRQDPALDVQEFVEPEVLDLPQHTVTITDISEMDFSGHNGLRLGQNTVQESDDDEIEEQSDSQEDISASKDKKAVKAIFRKEAKIKHMKKVYGRHKVNYSHSMDKKFRRKNRQNFSGRKNKEK